MQPAGTVEQPPQPPRAGLHTDLLQHPDERLRGIIYLPTRIAELLSTTVGLEVGLLVAIPWLCAAVVMYLVTHFADRHAAHLPMAMYMLDMASLGIAAPVLLAFCFAASGLRHHATAVLDPADRLPGRCGGGRRHSLIGSLSTFAIAPGSTMAPLNARSGQAIETVTLKKVAGREVGGK